MTIGDLIGELQKHDPKREVVGAWDSGYGSIDHIFWDTKSQLLLLDVSHYEAFDA